VRRKTAVDNPKSTIRDPQSDLRSSRLLKHIKRSVHKDVENIPALNGGVERRVECFGASRGGFPAHLFGPDFNPGAFENRCGRYGSMGFWDIETLGLGDVPIFLVGLLTYEHHPLAPGPDFRLELVMARDPSAEALMAREVSAKLAKCSTWVTFNGRSFDYPRLSKRAFRHEIDFPGCVRHLDLLILVRRRWKGELPDCRLGTVERRLLGLERSSTDVPGREVPERYRDYVATGERRWIEPVLEHNRLDILAMVVLLDRLVELDPDFVTAGETHHVIRPAGPATTELA
jgi:hypothetical protein